MEVDLAQLVLGFVTTLLSGVLVGVFIEHLRFKHSLKIEKVKRLAPSLDACCPIVERIYEDSSYAVKILKRGGSAETDLGAQIHKVYVGLMQFQDWHSLFEQKGMKNELESVDLELHDRLVGLFTFGRLANKHGENYVSQNLKEIHESSEASNQGLKLILRS